MTRHDDSHLNESLLGSSHSKSFGMNDKSIDTLLGFLSQGLTTLGVYLGLFASKCEEEAEGANDKTLNTLCMVAAFVSWVGTTCVNAGYKEGSFGLFDGRSTAARNLRKAGLFLHVCAIAASLYLAANSKHV
eukprot:CAMPEP_0197845588 /NCGR_PEP_ID=MMETSP1438-20131217/2501_1 /TAXON_ID=1461541 /ORGANISM="Pterosperma sp., Strain CCMP1384" /LENGTH=131 /DNA_ID=CAMNT_0043456939 /DNA_START=248 /DNA_END=643 /DNA_ORIENTATION=+